MATSEELLALAEKMESHNDSPIRRRSVSACPICPVLIVQIGHYMKILNEGIPECIAEPIRWKDDEAVSILRARAALAQGGGRG